MGQIRFTDFLNVLMGCLLSCGSVLTLSMQEKKTGVKSHSRLSLKNLSPWHWLKRVSGSNTPIFYLLNESVWIQMNILLSFQMIGLMN